MVEKKKNIIYITGTDAISVREEIDRLERAFRERQSPDNIHRYHLDEISDWRSIEQETLAMGLFVEKRLFIFLGSIEPDGRKKTKSSQKEESLLRICEAVDDDIFLVLAIRGDGTLIDWLQTHADTRRFDSVYEKSRWEQRYSELDERDRNYILSRYRNIEEMTEVPLSEISLWIDETFQKLSLLSLSTPITKELCDSSLARVSGGKMFDLADAIMAENTVKSLEIYHRMTNESSSYSLLPSLIGLLRNNVYTKYLKEKGYTEKEIVSTLGAHPYVVKKAYQARIALRKLQELYKKILEANIAYRSGRGLQDPELGRNFAIERAFLGLKK